jgi:hypothetical protein
MRNSVIKLSSLVSAVLVLLLVVVFFPDLTYGLGLLLGSLASISGYIILDYQISRVKPTRLKGALIFNRLLRYSIYILVFLASYFNQKSISVLTTIIGLFMVKLSLLMMFTPSIKKIKGKK